MKSHNKTNIKEKLKSFFLSKEEIIFGYLFGSVVNSDEYRDIDIAVCMKAIPDLMRQGKLQSELNNLFEDKIDLVILNKLPNKNPAFAYEVVTKGELLFNKNPSVHTAYKSTALQHYFDTAYLRDQFEDAFSQRMTANKFGERNYE